MTGCCFSHGCCTYPHGRGRVVAAAQGLAILCLIGSVYLSQFLLTGGWPAVPGIAAAALILSSSCTQLNRCALVTAAVLCFATFAATFIVIAVLLWLRLGYYCNDPDEDYRSDADAYTRYICEQAYAMVTVAFISGLLWIPTGILALCIPQFEQVSEELTEGMDDTESVHQETEALYTPAP